MWDFPDQIAALTNRFEKMEGFRAPHIISTVSFSLYCLFLADMIDFLFHAFLRNYMTHGI
jgi:hypothetical protein